jgi:phage head maturation protease
MELVRRRDLKGSSFAFGLETGKGDRWTSDEQGAIREVREVSLLADVSVVLTPAYPASSVSVAMRSYDAWLATQAEPEAVAVEPVAVAVRSWVREAAAVWAQVLRNG